MLKEYNKRIVEVVVNSEVMSQQWKKYQKDFFIAYVLEVSFEDACNNVTRIMDIIDY